MCLSARLTRNPPWSPPRAGGLLTSFLTVLVDARVHGELGPVAIVPQADVGDVLQLLAGVNLG